MRLGERICKNCFGRGRYRKRISINLPAEKYYEYVYCEYCCATGIMSWVDEIRYGFDRKYLKKKVDENNIYFWGTTNRKEIERIQEKIRKTWKNESNA